MPLSSNSMSPTIIPGDKFIANMIIYKFEKPLRGDVVVFKEPIEDRVLYTKRIIGLPGERVKVGENGEIYINGNRVINKNVKGKYTRKGFMADKEWIIPKKGDTIEIIGGHAIIQNETVQDIDISSFKQIIEVNDKEVTDAIPYARFLLNGKDETGPILDFKYEKELAEKLFKGEKIVLDKDYYFVLGDNSNNSYDSRFWGFMAENRIKGKLIKTITTNERIGIVE
jgi:signal peptidase I